MKRYDDLSEDQKTLAVEYTLRSIIRGLMNGSVQIKLKHDLHQRVMTNILNGARQTGDYKRFQTFVERSKRFKEEVADMAEYSAKNAFYTEPREFVIYDIAD